MNGIRDGDVYKIINIYGRTFEIRYGYYEEYERELGEPIPIYPNFKENPVYTADGKLFVTQMQEICGYGSSKFKEGFCADCKYFKQGEDLIGVCQNPKNYKVKQIKNNKGEK